MKLNSGEKNFTYLIYIRSHRLLLLDVFCCVFILVAISKILLAEGHHIPCLYIINLMVVINHTGSSFIILSLFWIKESILKSPTYFSHSPIIFSLRSKDQKNNMNQASPIKLVPQSLVHRTVCRDILGSVPFIYAFIISPIMCFGFLFLP